MSRFTGHVLRGANISPANATITSEPSTGVARDIRSLPGPGIYTLTAPALIEARADQYRAAVLEAPGTTTQEFLVWAANTSSLTILDDPNDPTWQTETGTGTFYSGTLTVTDLDPLVTHTDGTNYVIITDNGNRSLSAILYIVVARGDTEYDDDGWVDPDNPSAGRKGTNPYLVFTINPASQNPVSGKVTITAPQLALLGGGLSLDRGDNVVIVRYLLAPARFWWTRNDRYETRFGWNGQTQRWEPYKGGSPKDLGILLLNSGYKLFPKVVNLPVGAYLPGNETQPDEYAMIRLGSDPGVTSLPVGPGGLFLGIQVKPDVDVEAFDFATAPALSGIMGQTSGALRFNPSFAELYAGRTVWYVPKTFVVGSNGVVGKMLDAVTGSLFVAPIPGILDCPLIRFGNRRYLQATIYPNDAAMSLAPVPTAGSVQVSASTGRIRLSSADVDQADPSSPSFSKHYLGEDVIYDGVALNATPQPVQKQVQLVDTVGNPATGNSSAFYIPDAVTLPDEFINLSETHRGLGISGVLDVPDGTGAIPSNPGTPASVRPGGDSEVTLNTGRVRQVYSIGDTILFSGRSAMFSLHYVDRESDLPSASNVGTGEAWIARERGITGSKVMLNSGDLASIGDGAIYFLQTTFTPAVYTQLGQLISRNRDIFRFDGTEVLYFAIDGSGYSWPSSILLAALPGRTFFTAAEVASSIFSVVTGTGRVYASAGRILIEADDPTLGSVEIGFGNPKDLSGAAVLGFLPGWRAVGGVGTWLPDAGLAVGLFRTPYDLDRTQGYADISDVARVNGGIVHSSVPASPFVFLDNPPLQDVAGIDEGIFFALTTLIDDGTGNVQVVIKPLEHYLDIIHRFGQKKFDWISDGITENEYVQPVTILSFDNLNVVPKSLLAAPGIGGGLWIDPDGTGYVFQDQGSDYLLPQEGQSGTAILTERFGQRILFGAMGRVVVAGGTTFEDVTTDYTGVQPGYRLKITSGSCQGSYLVRSVLSPTALVVSPNLRTVDAFPVTWEVYEGYSTSVYDPALVADMFYDPFSHLTSEPFKVRLLSPLGAVPDPAIGGHLKANMAGALASGRNINVRYGLTAPNVTNTATLVALTQTVLGPIANGSLIVSTTEPRFSTGAFDVQIGTDRYTPVGVVSFSPDPVTVEYLLNDDGPFLKGTLKFKQTFLTTYSMAQVVYVETFLAPSDLTALTVEYAASTGELSLSENDMTVWQGTTAYFVEQMITEDRQDVSLNPILGSFAFNQPIPKGSSVEAEYWLADLEGRKVGNPITEFLPVFVRNEVAVRVDDHTYTFNSQAWTVVSEVEPIVFLGAIMQNFGTSDCVFSYPGGRGQITFLSQVVTSDTIVKVNYAVLEAQGGEQAFETSSKPVYRPPFYIKANQSRFGLRGNRAADFQAGQMLRFGEDCFYIRGTQYYPTSANGPVTSVEIFPTTINEVGSRAPANDVLSLVTDQPITTVVDPDGAAIPTTAPAGFMQSLDLNTFPFESVSRGQRTIVFLGNLMQFAVPGHIFEIGGHPHTISQAQLSEDGMRSRITMTAPFRTGFSMDSPPTVKLSYRPVYPPQTVDFIGVGPLVSTESSELVLFGRTDGVGELPGETLVPGIDYTLDASTGAIKILAPRQEPLDGSEKLLLSFTRNRSLQPAIQNGLVVTPRMSATYLYTDVPTEQNGLLGALLTGTYTFSNPDTFYFRAVPIASFLGEMAQEAIREIAATQPAGGPYQPSDSTKNWDQGRVGLLSQRKHLQDKDRASRAFLDFYNSTILAFEQIEETCSGGFIGDRDGKFRFWVGLDREYPTPGYEDPITGVLISRFVWSDAFNGQAADPLNPNFITVLPSDYVVTPDSFILASGVMDGQIPNPDLMFRLMSEQEQMILNDVDDLVLVRLGEPDVSSTWTYPFFHFKTKGNVARMVDSHRFSRLFPTLTRAFFMTYPGINSTGDAVPGAYTWGRYTDTGDWEETHGHGIGQLHNPAIGDLDNVRTAKLSKRRARARIWGYFPNGIPAGVFDGGTSPIITDPCVIASSVLLRDLQVDPDTGYPDQNQFISQSPTGTVPDLESGDPELVVPPFKAGNEIEWGKPDGTTKRALSPLGVSIFGIPMLTGVYIRDVLYGCVIRFKSGAGNISSPDQLLVGTGNTTGIPAHLYPIETGDTIYAGPNIGTDQEPADPPTRETMMSLASNIDAYRDGFDLEVTADGVIEDKTYPSMNDPSFLPIREILGQNPPDPLTPLEGLVEFVYVNENPLELPALRGEAKDDSGDYQIPYIRTTNTELDRFAQVFTGMTNLMDLDDLGTSAVYPDEIVSPFCDVVTGTLHFPIDITPAPALGVGPIQEYDLLLVQTYPDAGPFPVPGPQGIFSVGGYDVIGGEGFIGVPRFVTETTPPAVPGGPTGSPIQYTFDRAMAYIDTTPGYPYAGDPQAQVPPPPGVEFFEVASEGATYLKFTSIGQIVLNDGVMASGNLNDIWAASVNNSVTVTVYSRWDDTVTDGPGFPLPTVNPGGAICLQLVISQNTVLVIPYAGVPFIVGLLTPPVSGGDCPLDPDGPDPSYRYIKIPATGIIPWGVPPIPNQWFLPYEIVNPGPNQVTKTLYGFEFTVGVYTAAGGHSETAWISSDRLTFNEVIDMRLAKSRDTVHPQSGLPLNARLTVDVVTIGGGTESNVNSWCNGVIGLIPDPFTFPSPMNGTWSIAAKHGSIRVCGYEGWNNTPVTGSGISASLLPSSERMETDAILTATGKTASKYNAGLVAPEMWDDRFVELSVTQGAVTNVVPGDIVVVERSSNATHFATTMAGTYLVRHAVEATPGEKFRAVSLRSYAGYGAGWCPVHFPTVENYDSATHVLTLSDLAPVNQGTPVGALQSGFLPVGRLYVIRDVAGLASPDETTFRAAVVSAMVVAIATDPDSKGLFTLNPVLCRDAAGDLISEAEFETALETGMPVSGMVFWPVTVGGEQGLPSNNCVGYHTDADPPAPALGRAVFGFRWVSIVPPPQLNEDPTVQNAVFSGNLVDPLKIDVPAGAGPDVLIPLVSPLEISNVFLPDITDPIYSWVIDTLDVSWVQPSTWTTINIPATSWGAGPGTSFIRCVLPFSTLALENMGSAPPADPEGFFAQAGLFLEPSFPRMATNLATAYRHIVDTTWDFPDPSALPDLDRELGMRDTDTYVIGAPTGIPEEVTLTVRRIRRFHQTEIYQNLRPLRFAYEIRRGIIMSYTPEGTRQTGVVDTTDFFMNWVAPPGSPKPADVWTDGSGPYLGTNLGTFDNADVNIHPGDLFRLLGDDGQLIEEIPIASVLGTSQILLAIPGITQVPNPDGYRFEIYLRRPPVPHEQSNEQLLGMITDREIFRTDADWATDKNKGGYVPDTGTDTYEDVVNHLYDDSLIQSFSTLGARKGDIVIVDPAGTIPQDGGLPILPEKGGRPLGDLGVPGRLDAGGNPVYTAGRPTPLDDNRGFYRVKQVVENVVPPYMLVDRINTFAGEAGTPEIFAQTNNHRAYAVYPTIDDSALAVGLQEGQMDLRPTAVRDPVTKKFDDRVGLLRFHSIRPFSYRVIRPSKLFTDETIDLVLMHRERMLSLIELLRRLISGYKSGTYYVFQRDDQLDELGDPRDPDIGLGVISNPYLLAVIGRTDVVPFSNNEYALSLLDRRFWIYDRRLDSLTTDPTNPFNMKLGVPAYTAYTVDPDGIDVNPVLPERVEQVLNTRDRFRPLRYTWLAYRTNRVYGTLAAIARFDTELPRRLVEQFQAVERSRSLDKVQQS